MNELDASALPDDLLLENVILSAAKDLCNSQGRHERRVPHPSALFALGWDSTPVRIQGFFFEHGLEEAKTSNDLEIPVDTQPKRTDAPLTTDAGPTAPPTRP